MLDLRIKNPKKFTADLLEEYLAGGMGRMQKRDIDVFILHLLIQDGRYSFPKDIFRAARDLKLTEARLRNLYQDVQLRYQQLGEDQAKEAFVELIKKGAFELKKSRFVFIVRDPMLGHFFEEWVASVEGFTDSSFNPNLVSVSKEVLLKVLATIAATKIGEFPEELEIFNAEPNRPSVIRLFVEEFAKSAGKEAGHMTVKGLAVALGVILGVAG